MKTLQIIQLVFIKKLRQKKAHRESGLISEADYLKRGYSQHDAAYNLYFILYISV